MKLRLEIELDYDADIMHEDTPEGRLWFFNDILAQDHRLILHSDEIGDEIGEVRVLRVLPNETRNRRGKKASQDRVDSKGSESNRCHGGGCVI